jgi:DNA-binding response OmpR family regulator
MILVVEDDGPSGRAIALALKTAGHEVMNAADGTEELLAKHEFELVITDVVMPNLNGMDLLINTIRPKRPQMPVILMSGHL